MQLLLVLLGACLVLACRQAAVQARALSLLRRDGSLDDDAPLDVAAHQLRSRVGLTKLLRRKRRKLKQLAGEIELLKRRLHEPSRSANATGRPALDTSCAKSALPDGLAWRKRIELEVRMIHKKLTRIKSALKKMPFEPVALRNASKVGRPTPSALHAAVAGPHVLKTTGRKGADASLAHGKRHPNKGPAANVGSLTPASRRSLLQNISARENGNRGSKCQMHRECKPGLCCHDHGRLNDLIMTTKGGICQQHNLKESLRCSDSCQCELGLSCFRATVSPPSPSPDHHVLQPTRGRCKVAHTDDVLLGKYVSAPDSSFASEANSNN